MFNYVTVDFPTIDIKPEQVLSFTLNSGRYSHEMAEIKFRDWDVQFNSIRPGTPVNCVLKSTDSSRNFYGYVHHIKTSTTPGKRFVTLHVIGASYKLKQARQRVYVNQTADRIVESIAKEYNFAYYTEPHPRVYPQVVQAGHTDLELMTRLAKQCGYSLRVQNTEIYFQSLTRDYQVMRSSAPVFAMREQSDPAGSTIYSFSLTAGESIVYSDSYKSATAVGGIDPITGAAFKSTTQDRSVSTRTLYQPEFFDSFATKTVAPGFAETIYEAVAAEERNRFPYRATVSVVGYPKLRADMPIYLDGLGKDYSGYWIVLAAQHRVIEQSRNNFAYVTLLEVGADSLGSATVWTDGNLITVPDLVPTRNLIPNKRNTVVSPNSVLSTASAPDALDIFVPFGETENRSQPSTGKLTFTAPLWKSDSGNLNVTTTEIRRPSFVYDRLEARGVL